MSPYQIVNGKECHLPVELKYKAWWAINKLNFDYDRAKLERIRGGRRISNYPGLE